VLVRALLTGMFAVGIEWLRGDAWYLRFPWYTVPHALAQAPIWIAPVRWIGTYGLSFAIWIIAALGAFYRPWVWCTYALLPACALLLPAFEHPNRQALLLQIEDHAGIERLIPKVTAEPAHLAVCPEYSYFDTYQKALAGRLGPQVLARKLSCPVVFGAVDGAM